MRTKATLTMITLALGLIGCAKGSGPTTTPEEATDEPTQPDPAIPDDDDDLDDDPDEEPY